jgi:putative membrane protein
MLTKLLYFLIALHCLVLMIGGYWTYAEVPAGWRCFAEVPVGQ